MTYGKEIAKPMFDVSTLTEGRTYELNGLGNYKLIKLGPGLHEFASVETGKRFVNDGTGVARLVEGSPSTESETLDPSEEAPQTPADESGEVGHNLETEHHHMTKKERKQKRKEESTRASGTGE
jgi:hypothetical protein